jgi:hypothetical protein
MTSDKADNDVNNKTQRHQELYRAINGILKGQIRKETKFKIYKVMVVFTLSYGSETQVKKNKNVSKIQVSSNELTLNSRVLLEELIVTASQEISCFSTA